MINHIIHYLPLLSLAVVLVLWFDTRYVHEQNSQIRFTNLQIQVLENERDEYLAIENPTKKETSEHQRVMQRLAKHEDMWDELLGITSP